MGIRGRYTEYGRDAFAVAEGEAARAGSLEVEPEHLLLGVLHHRDGVAARVLEQLQLAPESLWQLQRAGTADAELTSRLRLSSRARRVVKLAQAEAHHWGDWSIGTAHLLLAIVRDDQNRGALALRDHGLDIFSLRRHVVEFALDAASGLPGRPALGEAPPRCLAPFHRADPAPYEPRIVKNVRAWLILQLAGGPIAALALVPFAANWGYWTILPICALLWTAACAGLSLHALGWRERHGWAFATTLLFVTSGASLALLLGMGVGLSFALLLCAVPWNIPLLFHLGGLVMLPAFFRQRAWFGVGEREGWMTLFRESGWMLGITAALDLATLALLLRSYWQHNPLVF